MGRFGGERAEWHESFCPGFQKGKEEIERENAELMNRGPVYAIMCQNVLNSWANRHVR